MAAYGPLEIPRVLLVRPDVRDFGLSVMRDYEAAFPGEKLFIPAFGGWRADEVQAMLVAESAGQYRVATSKAYHTKGAALDFQRIDANGKAVPQDAERDKRDPHYIRLGKIIESYGYRAGINFVSGLPDPYHADTNEPWDVVTAKWDALKKKVFSLPAAYSPSSA